MYKTLDTRKRNEARRRSGIADILSERLGAYAKERGGRFILFGSLARGEARFDSDVDLLVDFAPEWEGEAWRLAEALCADLKVDADIRPLGWCEPDFLSRIMRDARVIG